MNTSEIEEALQAIRRKDARYRSNAYRFLLFEGLEFTQREYLNIAPNETRHMAGAELLEGLRQLSIKQFGWLAHDVWKNWGIRKTRDWGNIVYNLVDKNLLRTTEQDSIDEFDDVFEIEDALRNGFDFSESTPTESSLD